MGNFKCSRNQYEIDQMNMVSYALAVGSLMSIQVQVRTYPDVVYVSGIFWQKLVILQSIIDLMLSKKEQVLLNSCRHKC